MSRQLSLLAAGVQAPIVDDLEGLLCGPGHLVRGQTAAQPAARLSVLVSDPWRAQALRARLQELDLTDTGESGARGQPGTDSAGQSVSVRTRFDPRLLPLAERWTQGAALVAPRELRLDGARLWWWAVAAGARERVENSACYQLRLAPGAPQLWSPIGAALAEAGLPGVFVGPRAYGPAYRLVGTRRMARLAELLGEPPPGVPDSAWPPG